MSFSSHDFFIVCTFANKCPNNVCALGGGSRELGLRWIMAEEALNEFDVKIGQW